MYNYDSAKLKLNLKCLNISGEVRTGKSSLSLNCWQIKTFCPINNSPGFLHSCRGYPPEQHAKSPTDGVWPLEGGRCKCSF